MDPHLLFAVCNASVVPAWLLLALAPGWVWTQRVVHAVWFPLALGAVYLAALLANPAQPEGGGFGSLAGVMALFKSPWVTLAGWVHYLVFDLFVGAWEVRDARRRGIHHAWVLPCLALTFALGPIGLALYLLVRLVSRREPGLAEA